jgi:hypothetical protein
MGLAGGFWNTHAEVNRKVANLNTEAGLSDAQRDALYQKTWQAFQAEYVEWVAGLDLAKIDLRKLPRRQILASYAAPSSKNLLEAVAAADLVIRGEVIDIRPTAFDGTYVHLRVSRSLKGGQISSLVVRQGGGIDPTPDWRAMIVSDSLAAPLMLPGDKVIAMLRQESAGAYQPEGFTGLYWSTDQGMRPIAGNPFAESIKFQSEAAFESMILAAVDTAP